VADGEVADIPLMTGTTLEEMKLFSLLDPALANLDDAELDRRVAAEMGERAGRVLGVYRAAHPDAKPSEIWTAISTDHVFRRPAVRLAEAQAEHQRDTYMYLFTYSTPAFGGLLGSCHALEIPFVWNSLDAPGAGTFTGDGVDGREELARAMHESWISFA